MAGKAALFVIGFCLLVFIGTAALAQGTCDIDLSETVGLLVQAQAAASAGDSESATDLMEQARANLVDFQSACGTAETDTQPQTFDLTETFTLTSPLGTMKFNYPEGWLHTEPDNGLVVLGGSQEALAINIQSADPPVVEAGQVALIVGLADRRFFGLSEDASATPATLLSEIGANMPPDFGRTVEPTELVIGDRPAAEMVISGESYEINFLAVELAEGTDRKIYGIVLVVTAPGEVENYVDLSHAVAESIQTAR